MSCPRRRSRESGENAPADVVLAVQKSTNAHFLADEIHRLDLALMNGFHHLVVIQTHGGRQFEPSNQFQIGCRTSRIFYRLVTRQRVRHGPVIAGALHVVVAAQRISAGSRSHVIAGNQSSRFRDGSLLKYQNPGCAVVAPIASRMRTSRLQPHGAVLFELRSSTDVSLRGRRG